MTQNYVFLIRSQIRNFVHCVLGREFLMSRLVKTRINIAFFKIRKKKSAAKSKILNI